MSAEDDDCGRPRAQNENDWRRRLPVGAVLPRKCSTKRCGARFPTASVGSARRRMSGVRQLMATPRRRLRWPRASRGPRRSTRVSRSFRRCGRGVADGEPAATCSARSGRPHRPLDEVAGPRNPARKRDPQRPQPPPFPWPRKRIVMRVVDSVVTPATSHGRSGLSSGASRWLRWRSGCRALANLHGRSL